MDIYTSTDKNIMLKFLGKREDDTCKVERRQNVVMSHMVSKISRVNPKQRNIEYILKYNS